MSRLDLEDKEKSIWKQVESERWLQYRSSKAPTKLETEFDLLTGNVIGYKQQTQSKTSTTIPSSEDEFLTVAPGLSIGVHFDDDMEEREERGGIIKGATIKVSKLEEGINNLVINKESSGSKVSEPIDDILPSNETTIQLSLPSTLIKKVNKPASWARAVDANQIPLNYDNVISKPAVIEFPFELDPFQKQAVYHLERNESVFVAAHTSAGKTVVADYAIALGKRHMTRTIYTSPIKALSNQKFRDFRESFGDNDVGLLTGDVQVNPEASCLIMTTEILRSMLYKKADVLDDVEFVIFDEVHYVNDAERGVVWEEVIIMLPTEVTIIMLSATIPNTLEFADWVGRTKQKEVFVISTLKRPVPLEHYLYLDKQLTMIVDKEKRFIEKGYKEALSLQKTSHGNSSNRLAPKDGPMMRGVKQERSLWMDVTYLLKKKSLLPAVIFVFSKRKCEENADALANLDLCQGASEKSAIHLFLEKSTNKLKGDDRKLPQILRIREMLSRGIAVHHSGLLPILKEAIEMLFSRGLVKVLFATETFAMGVNMPARTVVFSGLGKHDGNGFRSLLAGEYTQMAGRAGRRGLDATGTVVIAIEEVPAELTLRSIILGTPTRLTSQFRLTFNMILNLLRVEALKIEEMIKASFSEHAEQKRLPEEEAKISQVQELLKNCKELECSVCNVDIEEFYRHCLEFHKGTKYVWEVIIKDEKLATKIFPIGRIIIVRENIPAIVLSVSLKEKNLTCLILSDKKGDEQQSLNKDDNQINEIRTPLPPALINRPDLSKGNIVTRLKVTIGMDEIISVADCKLDILEDKDLDQIQDQLVSFLATTADEELPFLIIPPFKSIELEVKRIRHNELMNELRAKGFSCQKCPELQNHFKIFHRRRTLVERLAEAQFCLSDQNLVLLPEYRARLELLRELGYIDLVSGGVTVKGRVACELNTVDELITTELLFENAFGDKSPAQIIALLSCMVFQEKYQEDVDFALCNDGKVLEKGWEQVKDTATRLSLLTGEYGLEGERMLQSLRPTLIQTVYLWATGHSFIDIMQNTKVLEGSIVRCIVRLDETCRELKGAARIMGDMVLARKMEEASQLIKRDICFTSSLYL